METSGQAWSGPLAELPGWARALLAEARVAHLGLLDDLGLPRVLPVTFALWAGALWSAIDRKPKADPGREPARLRYLRRRPEVAFTVDRYEDDWERLVWVQVLGRASVLALGDGRGSDGEGGAADGEGRELGRSRAEASQALEALAAKYPQYRADPPPGPLIRIAPRRALWWSARPGR